MNERGWISLEGKAVKCMEPHIHERRGLGNDGTASIRYSTKVALMAHNERHI